MKNAIVVIIAVMLLLVVGCSRQGSPLGIVGPSDQSQNSSSIGTVKIVMNAPGELGKTKGTVPTAPTQLSISWGDGSALDNATIAAGSNSVTVTHNFTRKQVYTVNFSATNPSVAIYQYNGGSTTFTVPDAATFSVTATLAATVEILNLTLPLTGTPVASTADTVTATWTNTSGGQAYTDQSTQVFAAGTLSSVTLTGLMQVDPRFAYTYTVTVHIGCNNSMKYDGTGTITMNPSTDYSLSIPMIGSGGTASAGSIVVALSKRGQLSVTLTWN